MSQSSKMATNSHIFSTEYRVIKSVQVNNLFKL